MPRAVLRQLDLPKLRGIGLRVAGNEDIAEQVVGPHLDAEAVHAHPPIEQHEAIDTGQRGDETDRAQHFALVFVPAAAARDRCRRSRAASGWHRRRREPLGRGPSASNWRSTIARSECNNRS